MENNKWYEGVEKEVSSLKEKMSKGDYYDYGLDLLVRIAKRVDDFSPECEECSNIKEQIKNILAGISNWLNATQEQKKDYLIAYRNISGHLRNRHGLAKKGWPLGIYMLIGGVLGALPGLIGALLESDPETQAWSLFVAIAGFIIGIILGPIIGLIINKISIETVDLSK